MPKNTNQETIPLIQSLRSYQAQHQANLVRVAHQVRTYIPGIFLQELLHTPEKIGAIWPSSHHLAVHMAAPVAVAGSGLVVELGAGTGSVTQSLLSRGISLDRLWVIEQSQVFTHHLRRRFPAANIVQGDAASLDLLLPANRTVDTIVSSLPLRSLPQNTVCAIIEQCRRCLAPGGLLVQFTYALWNQDNQLFSGFAEEESQRVWLNLPPARVRVFRRLV